VTDLPVSLDACHGQFDVAAETSIYNFTGVAAIFVGWSRRQKAEDKKNTPASGKAGADIYVEELCAVMRIFAPACQVANSV
jgi:hypothetical protein